MSLTAIACGPILLLSAANIDGDCASYRLEFSGPALWVAEPISRADLEHYAAVLQLSQPQRQELSRLHGEYCTQTRELRDKEFIPFAKDVRDRDRQKGYLAGQEREAMVKREEAIRNRMRSLDSEFFDSVTLMLSDEQQKDMPLLQLDRDRQRCGAPVFGEAIHGEARQDLVELLRELHINEHANGELRAVMLEYRQTVVPHLCAMARQSALRSVPAGYLAEQLRASTSADAEADSRIQAGLALEVELEKLYKPKLRDDRRLKDINVSYLGKIEATVDDFQRTTLRNEFNRRSYPKIYPDRTSAEPAITQVLALDSLSQEQRELINAAADQYRQQYRALLRQMEELWTDYTERRLGGASMFNHEIKEYENRLEALKANSALLQMRSLQQIRALLSPEQLDALPRTQEVDRSKRSSVER